MAFNIDHVVRESLVKCQVWAKALQAAQSLEFYVLYITHTQCRRLA